MTWDKLYTLDKKGKVRIFYGEVGEAGFGIFYKTYTGLLDGKLISKITLVKKGKQKRTTFEQAEFELNSKYSEKHDEGYKSLANLQVHFPKNLNDSYDVEIYIENILKTHPKATYTNANWDELPMLAMQKKKVKLNMPRYFIQPKLNGVRCLSKKDIRGIVLSSRGGQYYKIPHIEEELIQIFEENSNIILDGEIYKHGVPLQEISGAARRESRDMFKTDNWLEYHIYDVFKRNDNNAQHKRVSRLRILSDKYHTLSSIRFVETLLINNEENIIKDYHDSFLANGYEGAILRHPDGEYEFNVRSNNLVKVKEYQDEEFTIIGCKTDPTKSEAESFVFVLKNNINDLEFDARPTGTLEQKKDWLDNQSWRGKTATVRFFERSNEGLPLQGHVRHKDSICLIEHIRPKGE